MKRKIISLCIWIAFTALYIFHVTDAGRSDGASANSAIENYVEYYTEEYAGIEGMADGMTNAWSHSEFDDLEKQFKTSYAAIAIGTVIYFVVSIACYHYAFIYKKYQKQ